MSIKNEIVAYIKALPDEKLVVLKPILEYMLSEPLVIETDLTKEEKEIIKKGREEYASGKYIRMSMEEFMAL